MPMALQAAALLQEHFSAITPFLHASSSSGAWPETLKPPCHARQDLQLRAAGVLMHVVVPHLSVSCDPRPETTLRCFACIGDISHGTECGMQAGSNLPLTVIYSLRDVE